MSLTAGRTTKRRNGDQVSHPVGTGKKIFVGALVALLDSGAWACPAGTASSGAAVGVAEDDADNTSGSNGDINVPVRKGVFQFDNSASGDLIARTEIGAACYIVDDHTVAKTDNSGARDIAGTIVDVDSAGVWVDVGHYSITINEA